ncbi:phage tail protein I [Buttiauxella sp. 3AFRM03]|uniref:phage tail protein I n=1 Tax=Buttiauxella sp. 3AFRM03 TaxID=2479367 RepID=UPI000EF7E63B|nr:phage tail protein I [Buttiauxella sp. 3AFRM03]AYN30009.1 phage tail protein I [Buttiauxella sp. 3AFRM03]
MTFKSLLPPNATPGELAQEQVMAHVGESPIDIRTVKNPDLSPVIVLPWLAWESGVTFWDDAWMESQKRGAIKNSPKVNKTRGTPGAVREALLATGYSVDVIEWFNDTPPAAPYTFRATINGLASEAALLTITNQINDAKNARSLLSQIDMKSPDIRGEFFMGGIITGTITATIGTA